MYWKIGDPTIHNALFYGFCLVALIVAATAFLLMGRPFSKTKVGRPLLGLFCGLIFGGSFVLLGHLMVDGRFFAIAIEGDRLILDMADGDRVSLNREQVKIAEIKVEAQSDYLVLSTSDGRVYRAGPCGPECDSLLAALRSWTRQGDLSER